MARHDATPRPPEGADDIGLVEEVAAGPDR